MNDIAKLTAIIESGARSPAFAYGLSAIVFAHDDECPKMAGGDCTCDPDIYDGLTNQKIEAARPAPAGSESEEACD